MLNLPIGCHPVKSSKVHRQQNDEESLVKIRSYTMEVIISRHLINSLNVFLYVLSVGEAAVWLYPIEAV